MLQAREIWDKGKAFCWTGVSRDQDTLPGGWGGLLEQTPAVASFTETSLRAAPGEVLLEATGGHDGLGGSLQL